MSVMELTMGAFGMWGKREERPERAAAQDEPTDALEAMTVGELLYFALVERSREAVTPAEV